MINIKLLIVRLNEDFKLKTFNLDFKKKIFKVPYLKQ